VGLDVHKGPGFCGGRRRPRRRRAYQAHPTRTFNSVTATKVFHNSEGQSPAPFVKLFHGDSNPV
jgi:hypothetical protein